MGQDAAKQRLGFGREALKELKVQPFGREHLEPVAENGGISAPGQNSLALEVAQEFRFRDIGHGAPAMPRQRHFGLRPRPFDGMAKDQHQPHIRVRRVDIADPLDRQNRVGGRDLAPDLSGQAAKVEAVPVQSSPVVGIKEMHLFATRQPQLRVEAKHTVEPCGPAFLAANTEELGQVRRPG